MAPRAIYLATLFNATLSNATLFQVGRGLEVVLLRKKELLEDLMLLEKQGVKSFGMLYTLAIGLEMGGV